VTAPAATPGPRLTTTVSSMLVSELAGLAATGGVSIVSTLSTFDPSGAPSVAGGSHVPLASASVAPDGPAPQAPVAPAGASGAAAGAGSSGGHFFFFGILFLAAGLLLPGLLRRLREHTLGRPAPFVALSVSPD
jgi:hypothetical protein